MKFTDTVAIAGTRRRDDGYLVADASVARTGIQLYAGWEVGKPEMDVVRVYRPEEEVFSSDAMASFAHRPVTNDHPDEAVTADNWKEHAVGQTAEEVARDGALLRVPLMVADASAIRDIEDGKRELSSGYNAMLDWTAGNTADGDAFDAVQRNIRANHVAIVRRGRAGSDVRIGDDASKWGASPVNTPADHGRKVKMTDTLRKVMVDGLQVETTDAGAQAIDKLTKDKAAVEQKLADAEAKHEKAMADKDAEMAKKDAEIDDLKKKVLDEDALDAKVADRADLVSKAKVIAPDVKTDGVKDADIRKAVVKAKLGDEAIKDKSDAYIDARFDILAEDVKGDDQLRDTITHLRPNAMNDEAKAEKAAHQAMLDRLSRKKSA
ncbi:DUF2213 domain-containing protein [Nitratireductor sp. GCM10026969]|uniref:DUF2213 domain-containing protein n=1 Tax=Nitratireductor sp. GCM10026969 TaxID=3252645 RepID=UPI003614B3C8